MNTVWSSLHKPAARDNSSWSIGHYPRRCSMPFFVFTFLGRVGCKECVGCPTIPSLFKTQKIKKVGCVQRLSFFYSWYSTIVLAKISSIYMWRVSRVQTPTDRFQYVQRPARLGLVPASLVCRCCLGIRVFCS